MPNAKSPHDDRPAMTRSRAAVYLRVSTREQTVENQEPVLREWAARLGLDGVRVFADVASGGKADRAQLAALLEAARRREVDVLLIWSLDRLSREGIGPTMRYLDQLHAAGVRVQSHQEPWLDTDSPVWPVLVAFSAWWAQQERLRIGARIRAGQARARREGKRLGRPARAVDVEDVVRRRAAGETWRRLAKSLKVPTRTLRRYAARAGQKPQANFAPGGPGNPTPIAASAPAEGLATS